VEILSCFVDIVRKCCVCKELGSALRYAITDLLRYLNSEVTAGLFLEGIVLLAFATVLCLLTLYENVQVLISISDLG
jgi:hypothetical protein